MKIMLYMMGFLSGILSINSALAEVKPIPKAFHGKWVSHVHKKLTNKEVAQACRGDGEWGTWELTVNSKLIKMRYPAGGGGVGKITSYSKYSASNIQGVMNTKGEVEGGEFDENAEFNYTVKGNKLYSFEEGIAETFVKCR